ncbi:MAG: 3-deoxy-D-manno-octulosonate 8-phosphate phosphatase [Lachnospiraceae bacterium]|nr:3-deoxy-D-manno-octulosonate 8-phosphate phosphatase [Lachnospiraceae bacterium]
MYVYGTLKDVKIYMGENGELFKAFNIKDGCGIKDILPRYGIQPVIITARESKILENRCRELEITELYQGVKNKLHKLDEVINSYSIEYGENLTYKNVAYIGDDISDMQCMDVIKSAGGIVGCPFNAVKEVKEAADYISSQNGGEGSVREFIDWLVQMEQ